MKRLTILLAIACSAIGIASAQSIQLVEGAAELSLSDITFPASIAGTVIFQECESCDARSLPVDSNTVYIGLSGSVSLNEFLLDVAELRQTEAGSETFVGLFFDLQTNRVTRISLHPDAS